MYPILVEHSFIPGFVYVCSDCLMEVDISASAFSYPPVFEFVVYDRCGGDSADDWYNIVVFAG